MPKSRRRKDRLDRRKFLEIASTSALGAGLGSLDSKAQATARVTPQLIDNFNRTDSAYHGDAWETLTPGHWRIQWRALRRDMANCPDPPYGMLWHRAWKLTGDYRIEADITVRGLGAGDGHELFGICFGGKASMRDGTVAATRARPPGMQPGEAMGASGSMTTALRFPTAGSRARRPAASTRCPSHTDRNGFRGENRRSCQPDGSGSRRGERPGGLG